MTGWGYKQIARLLTTEGLPCPSAHDRARKRHRPAHVWAMSAVRAILANPCYLGYHVSGRTKKADVLIDPDRPALGHVTRQHWQDQAEWVTSSVRTYEALVDEAAWHRAQAITAAKTRTKAVTPVRHRIHDGTRRSEPSRYASPAWWSVIAAGRSSRATWPRGHAFYRRKASPDYPGRLSDHPAGLAVREDRLLPHIDAWLATMFAPGRIAETAKLIVEADLAEQAKTRRNNARRRTPRLSGS